MKIKQTTPVSSVVEPVELDDLRAHLDIEHNEEDSYLELLLKSARNIAEQHLDGIIADREFVYSLSDFSHEIELPLRPIDLDSISVAYTDPDGQEQTVSSFDYHSSDFGTKIFPDPGETWPQTQDIKDAVRITFTAGYKTAHGEVPDDIKVAIMMIVATNYKQRENAIEGTIVSKVPLSSEYLLAPYRKIAF